MEPGLARQRVVAAGVEAPEVATGELMPTDGKTGAPKADGSRFLEGEAQGMRCATKRARAEGSCGVPVAAEMKLGASEVVEFCHSHPIAERTCGRARRRRHAGLVGGFFLL